MRWNIIFAYLALAALCYQFELTNSRTSTLWRLNPRSGKITTGNEDRSQEVKPFTNIKAAIVKSKHITEQFVTDTVDLAADIYSSDHIFYIITSTLKEGDSDGYSSGWIRQSPESFLETADVHVHSNNTTTTINQSKREKKGNLLRTRIGNTGQYNDEKLDCGKPVNFTVYDDLLGIGQRHYYHPPVPEPEVAYLFLGSNDEYSYRNFDIIALERRLKRAKHELTRHTVELYNEIGNYFRIVGDSRQAIECFRNAVAIRPDPATLLSLARVLYNLEYYSDAMRVSLDSIAHAPTGYVPWQEYFILGEIFKASGRVQESSLHLRRALELYPHHEPILKVLRDVENRVLSAVHIYTLIIIIALVLAVFMVIISSSLVGNDICSSSGNNGNTTFYMSQYDSELRPQRHFNRAMAMRSLKGFRHTRHRRF